MISRLGARLANLIWFSYAASRVTAWKRATANVAGTQATVLKRIVRQNRNSAFGKEHRFADLQSIELYQQHVPLHTYEDLQPAIQRMADGDAGVLTEEKVQQFALTSGSTQAAKLIPYTKALVNEFQAGIDPWVYYLFKNFPRLLLGKTYWSVTPVGERRKYTAGGIPLGFDDEQQYVSPLTRWVLGSVMAVPSQLADVQDMEIFRYCTLRLLLQERSLSWISVWNPSFLTLLLDPLHTCFYQLIEDIEQGTLSVASEIARPLRDIILARCKPDPRRARELFTLYAKWQGKTLVEPDKTGRTFYEAIWPHLRLISCWAHGNAIHALPPLQKYFPHVSIQPKGLLATEAFISFPFRDDLSALSILSHFFEFEEINTTTPVIRLAHELQIGQKYAVIVTTGGGFYRYRLNDIIEVGGFYKQCPLIRFIGRQAKVVDICGEKLNEEYVQQIVTALFDKYALQPNFWMMAPEHPTGSQPHYTLFVQVAGHEEQDRVKKLDGELDKALQESYHYGYCRRLGQLEPARLYCIAPNVDTFHIYLTICTEQGQRLGDIKVTLLHPYQGWSQHFPGTLLVHPANPPS